MKRPAQRTIGKPVARIVTAARGALPDIDIGLTRGQSTKKSRKTEIGAGD